MGLDKIFRRNVEKKDNIENEEQYEQFIKEETERQKEKIRDEINSLKANIEHLETDMDRIAKARAVGVYAAKVTGNKNLGE